MILFPFTAMMFSVSECLWECIVNFGIHKSLGVLGEATDLELDRPKDLDFWRLVSAMGDSDPGDLCIVQ